MKVSVLKMGFGFRDPKMAGSIAEAITTLDALNDLFDVDYAGMRQSILAVNKFQSQVLILEGNDLVGFGIAERRCRAICTMLTELDATHVEKIFILPKAPRELLAVCREHFTGATIKQIDYKRGEKLILD
jgi:hypothetical protein